MRGQTVDYNGYIADGYTERGYIKEAAGVHQAVRFCYRPATHEERARIFEGWAGLAAVEQVGRTALALSKKILSWDLHFDGRAVASNEPSSYKQLKTPLFNRLLDVVCGTSAADVDPAAVDAP